MTLHTNESHYEAKNGYTVQAGETCAIISKQIEGVLIGKVKEITSGTLHLQVTKHYLPKTENNFLSKEAKKENLKNSVNQNGKTLIIQLTSIQTINNLAQNKHLID